MATASVTYNFSAGTLIKSSEANTDFQDLVTFLNNQVIQKDASVAFTAVPSGPGTDPISDNQFTRKAYVDSNYFLMNSNSFSTSGDGATHQVTSWTNIQSKGITVGASSATVTKAGLYTVIARGEWPTDTSGFRRGMIFQINGVTKFADAKIVTGSAWSSGIGLAAQIVGVTPLANTDVLTLHYNQDSGGSVSATFRLSVCRMPGTT